MTDEELRTWADRMVGTGGYDFEQVKRESFIRVPTWNGIRPRGLPEVKAVWIHQLLRLLDRELALDLMAQPSYNRQRDERGRFVHA